MATTSNVYIGPQDGWTAVETGGFTFIRLSADPHTHPFYVYIGAAAPVTADPTGIKVVHKPFWVNVSDGENVYVRVPNPVPGSSTFTGKLRIDVVAITQSTSGPVGAAAATVTTTVTRPADTTAYAANDAWADSTSAPTSGGFTFTAASRASGGSGIITDVVVVSSNDPATTLQGELWVFDTSVTAVNDNAAFALSDTDAVKLVGVVPFTLLTTTAGSGTNSYANIQNLALGFTSSGTANLRFLVKVKNAYTPASAEALTFRLKIVQTN